MGEFIRTKVVPETDAYVLSKLSRLAVTKSHTVAVGGSSTLAADIYKMLIDAILGAQDAAGSDEELVAFVDSTVFSAIMNSAALSKTLVASEFKHGDINLIVKSVNGVPILHVPSARMKTAYTFYDGTSNPGGTAPDERPGGFVPTADANNIGLIVMPKKAASLVRKTEKVRVWTPDQNQDADAWKFQYRLYYDLLIKKSNEDSIYTYTYQSA